MATIKLVFLGVTSFDEHKQVCLSTSSS